MTGGRKADVEIEHLSLAFGPTPVLRDVGLHVAAGEFFGLLGPSGSGKSTLLRAIAGFGHPQRGTIRIGGRDVTRLPPWRRGVGMMFQSYALWPHLTVWQNVAFGLEERRLARRLIADKVAAVLDLVGLGEYAQRRPGQLSGGQQQRVALARTIVIEPQVLLLDEPLSNLDAKLRAHMRLELRALQRKLGITTLFVTHDQDEALAIADRVAVIDQGVIQQVGTPLELYDAPLTRFVANFVGSVNLIAAEAAASGDQRIAVTLAGGARFELPGAPARGRIVLAFRPNAARLDAQPPAGGLALDGAVLESEFQGENIRYRVRTAAGELLADTAHLPGQSALVPGARVWVGVDPAHIRVLRE